MSEQSSAFNSLIVALTGEVIHHYFVADEQLTNDTVAMILQVNER